MKLISLSKICVFWFIRLKLFLKYKPLHGYCLLWNKYLSKNAICIFFSWKFRYYRYVFKIEIATKFITHTFPASNWSSIWHFQRAKIVLIQKFLAHFLISEIYFTQSKLSFKTDIQLEILKATTVWNDRYTKKLLQYAIYFLH